MAAITIRNLPDDVVETLKVRARRNGRSMESDVRELLTRLAADESPDTSGLEHALAQRLGARRWYTTGDEVATQIAANPPADEDLRVAAEWLTEHRARPYDEADAWDDPWERTEQPRAARESGGA